MANSGKSQQPGGGTKSFSMKMNRVSEIAAAWRGELLPTTIRLVPGAEAQLERVPLTVAGNTLSSRGAEVIFYLRPGKHELALDLKGQEVTLVWVGGGVLGEAPEDPLLVTAGESYAIEISDSEPDPDPT